MPTSTATDNPKNQTTAETARDKESSSGPNPWHQRTWFKTEVLVRVLLVLLIIIAATWLASGLLQVVNTFSSLLLLFFASWLVALMLTPLVRRFVTLGWPKPVAIGAVYALLLSALVGFGILVLPGLIAQTQLLSNNLGGITTVLEKNLNKSLKGFGLNNVDLAQASTQFQTFGSDLLKNALNVATGVANFVVQLLLLLIISFSFLAGRDYQKPETLGSRPKNIPIAPSLWQRLPERWRRWLDYIRLSFERNFGVFLLGQITIALIYGTLTGFVMLVGGFDYPITTACMCGALMVIPFFGGPLSLLPPLIVAFNRDDSPIVIVLIFLFVIQTLLLNVVLPKLVGKTSGVGPVTTLFVLLAGAQIGGVLGVLLAVPISGVLKSLSSGLIGEFFNREENRTTTPPGTPTPVVPVVPVELDMVALVNSGKPRKGQP